MGPPRLGWMWTVPLAFLLASGGCSSSDSANPDGGAPQTLDAEDAQELFDAIAADLAALLVEGLDGLQPKAYPDCPGGGTLTVAPNGVTFTGCTISGITIDGSTSTFSQFVEGAVTTVSLSGVFMISGFFEGDLIVQDATFIRGGQNLCWRARGTVEGIPFDVQSLNQSCSDPAICGDGTVSGTEECDDGNTTDGDGCDGTCVIERPTCDPSDETCLVGEEFEGSMLDGWAVDFINADDWTHEVTGGELVVTGVRSTLECNLYGQEWSFVRLTRTFDVVDDYTLVMSASWDPGGDAAIQKVQVTALGSGMSCQANDQTHLTNFHVPACAMAGAAGQLDGIPGAGSGTFVIQRCNGEVSASFNGAPIAMGAGPAATGVRIWFGWYKVDQDGSGPDCTPAPTPLSTFGEIRVDRVSLESGCGP